MFREDNCDHIFAHRQKSTTNIQIIKKFFVLPSTNGTRTPAIKPLSSLVGKSKEANVGLPRKNNPKFTGGFQQCSKSVHNDQEQLVQTPSIMIKSKKAPTNEISSFLLGLTTRIQQESLAKLQQQQFSNTILAQRRSQFEQVKSNLTNLGIFKKQTRIKYASVAPTQSTSRTNNNNTNNIHSCEINTQNGVGHSSNNIGNNNHPELPYLQKRLTTSTSPQRKGTAIGSFTPLSNKSSTPSCLSEQSNEKKSQKLSLNSNRTISMSYSSKIVMPPEQQSIVKGYLYYDPGAKQFLQQNIKNSEKQAKIMRNFQSISALNYIVLNRNSLEMIAQKNSTQQIQIASLTKIMTCYLCILVCRKYKIQPKQIQVRVSERAQQMLGTSAELQAGDIVTLKDLLYGLMLPSGNDASVAIAQTVGKIIQRNKKKLSKKTYFQTFIYHMNYLSKQIGIQQNFQNCSGLSFNPNFSSPKAIAILTGLAMRNKDFYQVINCKQYNLDIHNERYGLMRKQSWKNTNKLLWKGWQGVKTGTTQSAGHCLMSCKDQYIISVFNCQTLNKRFTECIKIYEQINSISDGSVSQNF